MVIVNDVSMYKWIFFLKTKDKTFDFCQDWKLEAETQYKYKVETLCTQKGEDSLSKEVNKNLVDHGTRHQLTTAHTPSQNGVAEGKN